MGETRKKPSLILGGGKVLNMKKIIGGGVITGKQ